MKKNLLVEDDLKDVELTMMALAEYDLADTVQIVHNGEEALDYLYSRKKFKLRAGGDPLVVLLDLKMPKLKGLDVLRIIKTEDRLKCIPVVVLTSSREKSDLIECYKNGINAYVVKPVDFTEFMRVIRQLAVFWVEWTLMSRFRLLNAGRRAKWLSWGKDLMVARHNPIQSQSMISAGMLPVKEAGAARKILMADDEPMICELCTSILSREGYHVDVAVDGTSAWEALQLEKYDLLITDHQMPGLTGLGLIKNLHAAGMPLPVIMASASIPTDELNRHPWLKVKGMLLKPYSVDTLLTEVRKILHLNNDDSASCESWPDASPS